MKEAKFYVDYCFEAGENDSLSGRYQFGIKLSDGEYEELYNVWYISNCELNSWATEWDGHDALYCKINDAAVMALRQHLEQVDDITKDPLDTYWELSAETQKAF